MTSKNDNMLDTDINEQNTSQKMEEYNYASTPCLMIKTNNC